MSRLWSAVTLPGGSPLRLFDGSSPDDGRYYFRTRSGLDIAGLGVALQLESGGERRLEKLSSASRSAFRELCWAGPSQEPPEGLSPLFLGGFSFDPSWERVDEQWRGFPPSSLVLPQVSVLRHQGKLRALAIAPADLEDPEARRWLTEQLNALVEAWPAGDSPTFPACAALGRMSSCAVESSVRIQIEAMPRNESSEPADFPGQVQQALDAIHDGLLSKVAVARAEDVASSTVFEPAPVLARLNERFASCFVFCVQPPGASAFVGASPERLVSCADGRLSADALAGTSRRGLSSEEDDALGAELLASEKETREHASVVTFLEEALRPVTVDLNAPDSPVLMRLANVQHLHTPFEGVLSNGEGVLDLAQRLHPTPAVAGFPRDQALAWLARSEELDRGWYAGGVGVVGPKGEGEYCVAIRSGLFGTDGARLFAGAGVVEGSVPQYEDAEVGQKLAGLKEVLVHA